MINFRIRPCRPADLPALRNVYRRASLSNSGDVAKLLAHPDVLLLTDHGVNEGRTRVATQVPDHIVGFATTCRTGRVLELEDLFVNPDWMRRGVGRALMQDVQILAAQENIRRVEVTANSHALSFYKNVGFVPDNDVDTPVWIRLANAPRHSCRPRHDAAQTPPQSAPTASRRTLGRRHVRTLLSPHRGVSDDVLAEDGAGLAVIRFGSRDVLRPGR